MIEQTMYFALGLLVAGLLFLMFLPAFWRRATRLSMRRLQMLMPLSMEEVVAERDLLRADFAVRERRMEQEMDAVRAAKALDLAAIGRHAARIAELEARAKAAEAETRDREQELREAQKVLADRTGLLSATERALAEVTERAERGVARSRLLESDKDQLDIQTRAHLTRISEDEAKIDALRKELATLRGELSALRETHQRVSVEAARVSGLERDVARLSAELEAASATRARLTKDLEDAQGQCAALREKSRNDVQRLEASLRAARDEARDSAEKLDAARADNAMLQGAVEALRAERAEQRRGNGARGLAVVASSHSDADVAALREAVIGFGERVAQMEDSESAKQQRAH